MKRFRRTQLLLLATVTMIVAATAAVWWVSSPESAIRAGKAMAMLATVVCAIEQGRRWRPSRSPSVLAIVLAWLGVLLVARPGVRLAIVLAGLTAVAWIGIAIARFVRDRRSGVVGPSVLSPSRAVTDQG